VLTFEHVRFLSLARSYAKLLLANPSITYSETAEYVVQNFARRMYPRDIIQAAKELDADPSRSDHAVDVPALAGVPTA
jgi:hypothetical protein